MEKEEAGRASRYQRPARPTVRRRETARPGYHDILFAIAVAAILFGGCALLGMVYQAGLTAGMEAISHG